MKWEGIVQEFDPQSLIAVQKDAMYEASKSFVWSERILDVHIELDAEACQEQKQMNLCRKIVNHKVWNNPNIVADSIVQGLAQQ